MTILKSDGMGSLARLVMFGAAWVASTGETMADESAPLLGDQQSIFFSGERDVVWLMEAAHDALYSGFTSVAERLFKEALNSGELHPDAVPAAMLKLSSALISEGKFTEAGILLDDYPNKDDGAYRLRSYLVRYQRGEREAVERSIATLAVVELEVGDKPWHHFLKGLLLKDKGDLEGADAAFLAAKEMSVSDAQRAEFQTHIVRNRLFAGKVDEALVADLKLKTEVFRGQRAGYEFARQYAIALDQMFRTEEAVEVIDSQLRQFTVREREVEDQFLLLMGLIAGERSQRGRSALQELLRKSSNHELQEIALHLLSRQPLSGEATFEFATLLDEMISLGQHPLLDSIYYYRAQLALSENRLSAAEADAKSLLERIPGSQLRNSAIRLLAYIAWRRDPPQYRTAADYLNQLRNTSEDPEEKAMLGVLIADCYFLNADFERASETYASVVMEKSVGIDRSTLLFQRVLSEIRAGRLEDAQAQLDDPEALAGVTPLRRWQAEWNLLTQMKADGDISGALVRARRLLKGESSLPMPQDLRLRLMWLEARLSIEAKEPEDIPERADLILEALKTLPEESLDREMITTRTLLLKGEAYFQLGDIEEGLAIFDRLRGEHPEAPSTVLTYLIEGRFYFGMNQLVDAERTFKTLAERYRESEAYAPVALWEAAIAAEQRHTNTSYREAIKTLERLVNQYSGNFLVYYARLRQADLSRRLNEFGTAQLIYEEVINQFPDHPERYRAEISLADSFVAQATQNKRRLGDAAAIYERLVYLPQTPLDLQAEAGYKWGLAKVRQREVARGQEIFYLLINRLQKKHQAPGSLGGQGRYWLAKCLLELALLFEQERRFDEARSLYADLATSGLPGKNLAEAKIKRFAEARR